MIYILDTATGYPGYSFDDMANKSLGGTESGILSMVQALGADKFELVGHPDLVPISASTVIHIRTAQNIPALHKRNSNIRHIIWHHDLGGPWVAPEIDTYIEHKPELVFLTEYHKMQFVDRGFRPYTDKQVSTKMHVINYIMPGLPDLSSSPYNKNKLLYCSSPHKGLEQTLAVFTQLRVANPALELHVCNPGYLPVKNDLPDGVVFLGELPSWRVWEEMVGSLAVFQMNHIWAETFGKVYVEANLLGVPVITHPIGALNELIDKRQFVDTRSASKVGEVVSKMQLERLKPSLPVLNNGLELWKGFLGV